MCPPPTESDDTEADNAESDDVDTDIPVDEVETDASDDTESTDTTADTSESSETGLESHLPDATIDSRWWYWIAAVPVYVVLTALLGVVFFVVAFLGVFLDVGGPEIVVVALAFVLLAIIPGLILTVLFPVALYVDAKAVEEADLDWNPDPVLYGLAGLGSVLMTAFTVSAIVALYYIYQRHKYVGTP